MLYYVDGNYKIMLEYQVEGCLPEKKYDDTVDIFINTDKGKLKIHIAPDENVKDVNPVIGILCSSCANDICLSYYLERSYLFISQVNSVADGRVDADLIYKVTGSFGLA